MDGVSRLGILLRGELFLFLYEVTAQSCAKAIPQITSLIV